MAGPPPEPSASASTPRSRTARASSATSTWTNATVGDFQFDGNTTVPPQPDGTYRVVLDSAYHWNDIIDPNPEYTTDQQKSQWAEWLTLGMADPYNLQINWQARSTVTLDRFGNVLKVEGYPFS